jgi:flavorubredoxin
MTSQLYDNIDSVGSVDWTIRDFHSYDAERGVTYNAYLVRDEKTALIDTVKAPFAEELLQNVASLADPARVDYVVCNHAELDHAGALPEVMRAMPQATILCDKRCAITLGEHFDTSAWKIRTVANGQRIPLGRRTLQFVETPMVHWPESMFTYVPEEKLLFSMDAFGQHYATSARFDDEADLPQVMQEAKSYYANIILPYGKAVLACLDEMAGLPIDMIAPSHGLIWRRHGAEIVAAYRDWASHRCKPKVLVIYDSMWESTAEMAKAILDGALEGSPLPLGEEQRARAAVPSVSAKLIHVRRSNLTQIATEVLDAAAMAFGTATLNRGMMPMMAATLSYFDGLRPSNKAAVAFGSYGWGKGGPEAIDHAIRGLDWDVLREPIRARYRPTPEILGECRAAGRLLAERASNSSKTRLAEH